MFNDYVVYIDTDSVYIKLGEWLQSHIDMEKWDSLSLEEKIEHIKLIGKVIENYVNERSFHETQKIHYNSKVDDFAITFEQEKIAFSALFTRKKRYATWTITDGGKWKDEISITGMEIIRSDSPEVVKPMIKKIVEMVLKFESDDKIRDYIRGCKNELRKCSPEEISENKSINNISKYISKDGPIKGTPHQLKGWYNLKILLDRFNLNDRYDIPQEGNKAKVAYLQNNPYRMNSLSFLVWPEELVDRGINIDYNKMIENNFTKKLETIFSVINKENLITGSMGITNLFGG